jgi:hypothetical protein
MNTDLIRSLTKDLDLARKSLIALRAEAETLNLGHQGTISVCVPGATRAIVVAQDGGRSFGWQSRMVRGREMIMLGIKKAYAAMIESERAQIEVLKEAIAKEAA